MVNKERLLSQFLELVEIDSVSFSEGKIASRITSILTNHGAQVVQDNAGEKIKGDCGNLIAKFQGTLSKYPFLLNAHLDTVQSTSGMKPSVVDDIIKSDGSTILGADDKSGVAVILEAINILKEKNIPHPPLEVVFTVAEEQGLMGAANLNYSLLTAKEGISVDSGNIEQFVISAPSKSKIKFIVHGLGAHAGAEPEKGIHAIRIAADAVSKMNLGIINEITTANIGSFISSFSTNIIPDKVEIEGEVRSSNDFALHAQLDHMIECFLNATIGIYAIRDKKKIKPRIEYRIDHKYDAFTLAEDEEICLAAFDAARKMGLKPQLVSGMGGTDANHFNNHGIKVLLMGTGIVDAHSKDESIALSDMVKSAELLIQILSSL
ncbi:MAG: hypothetical protein A2161_06960 [Candidatus Schekmanbacteria bacterium RBG_13_48_7]|uniref:Peptidase M20 dimerisation domain-containing protein n=1 Tax=Candidatus Schekmanbacteria bacterium RBG_13_48_7 TaxID=1817878 RepID=A0A1F7RM79_9BACT|nr:MAG: hypothetical protein A2161_06960 [Candidatus Schekmanbacteria bacterium RBG_13_48_7]